MREPEHKHPGRDVLDKGFQLLVAAGMPGVGKSRMAMVEWIAMLNNKTTKVVPVVITFNWLNDIETDEVVQTTLDAALGWRALHAVFGYEQCGAMGSEMQWRKFGTFVSSTDRYAL